MKARYLPLLSSVDRWRAKPLACRMNLKPGIAHFLFNNKQLTSSRAAINALKENSACQEIV
jgi:hypothetical protein